MLVMHRDYKPRLIALSDQNAGLSTGLLEIRGLMALVT
jgi:hypothetical protein